MKITRMFPKAETENNSGSKLPDSKILIENSENADFSHYKESNPARFNLNAEARFKKLVCKLLTDNGGKLALNEAVGVLANHLDVSPTTIRRYFEKHANQVGQFEIRNRKVYCKKHDHRIEIIKPP